MVLSPHGIRTLLARHTQRHMETVNSSSSIGNTSGQSYRQFVKQTRLGPVKKDAAKPTAPALTLSFDERYSQTYDSGKLTLKRCRQTLLLLVKKKKKKKNLMPITTNNPANFKTRTLVPISKITPKFRREELSSFLLLKNPSPFVCPNQSKIFPWVKNNSLSPLPSLPSQHTSHNRHLPSKHSNWYPPKQTKPTVPEYNHQTSSLIHTHTHKHN